MIPTILSLSSVNSMYVSSILVVMSTYSCANTVDVVHVQLCHSCIKSLRQYMLVHVIACCG